MKIDDSLLKSIYKRLFIRKARYLSALNGNAVDAKYIIVGDRPSPSAPVIGGYHYTPFFSLRYCSGWLNRLLEVNQIDERNLLWLNSANLAGESANFDVVRDYDCEYIALGSNAEKWLISNGKTQIHKTYHPQYWKRFRSKERYPLLDLLRS